MTYSKPQLLMFEAMAIISDVGDPTKAYDALEPSPNDLFCSDPAYQADE